MSQPEHQPVLLKESIDLLAVKPAGIYVDCTFGGGGHAQAILKKGAKVIGIDRDEEAITRGRTKIDDLDLTLVHDDFLNLADILARLQISQVDGILYDLGTSAYQLESPGRGFSFMRDEPLDMRMDLKLTVTAKDLVNGLGLKELELLFTKMAQEPRARAISRAIIDARRHRPITTTGQLAGLVESVYRGRRGKLHPATKVFQALRMAVNSEREQLELSLPQAITSTRTGGRIVVISFHEGEDRIVKHTFKKYQTEAKVAPLTKKPLTPSLQEIDQNARARSAKLRAVSII